MESSARNLVAENFFANTGDTGQTFPTTPSCVVAEGVCVYSTKLLSLSLSSSEFFLRSRLLDLSPPRPPHSSINSKTWKNAPPRVSMDV